jgi:hypothetical protein
VPLPLPAEPKEEPPTPPAEPEEVPPPPLAEPEEVPPVSVLDRQTYQEEPEVVDCAVRIVIGRPRTRRYAQGHGTQDLYRFGLPRWRTLRPVWGNKYGALCLVLVEIRSGARLGTRPSFI